MVKILLTETRVRNIVFWSFGFSGLAALLYEVVWFRALSLVVGSTTYALSTMLATFMAGLSIGSYLGGLLADKAKKTIFLYAFLEGLIAVIALLVLPIINIIPPMYARLYYSFQFSFTAFSVSQFFLCFLVMIVPTTLMGATFPVVCRIIYSGHDIGREMGKVYSVNTVGAIAGSLIAGFALIPLFGLKITNIIGGVINLSIALICLFTVMSLSSLKGKAMFLAFMVLFASSLFFSIVSSGEAYPFNYYSGKRYNSYEGFWFNFGFAEKLYERDDAAGNVKVLKTIAGEKILVNNSKVESDNLLDLANLAALAYIPVAANPSGKSFLSIGHGTGATIYYAATVQGLEEIYSVEINPSIVEASRLFFHPGIFKDPRVSFIIADARNYLTIIGRKYDIISSEPSYPVDQGFSHLYSKEFFEIVKSRLNEGGVFCQWVPRYIFRGEEFRMILRTFQVVFPEVSVWKIKDSGDFLLAGKKGGILDTGEMAKSIGEKLGGAGLSSEGVLLVSDREDVENRLSSYKGAINTDNHPLVEFIGARRMFEVSD